MKNNATLMEALMLGRVMTDETKPRHLLPVFLKNIQACEGSPSRAQYIEGQPRDTREGSSYDEELEESWRSIHQMLAGAITLRSPL